MDVTFGAYSILRKRFLYSLYRVILSLDAPKKFEKSVPEFGETHSSVLGCETRPVSASIMSRSSFASFPVCVYKFSSHYLNNIIFYRQQFGTSSDRITLYYISTVNTQHMQRPDVVLQLGYTRRHVSAVKQPSSGQRKTILLKYSQNCCPMGLHCLNYI